MITVLYGLVCWLSPDIAIANNILAATVILDITWIAAGGILRWKLKK